MFTDVRVNESRARRIADWYMTAPEYDQGAEESFHAFASQTADQYAYMVNYLGVNVTVQEEDPYANADEMFADARTGVLRVFGTAGTGGHPYLTDDQNDKFRAVHDYFGHFGGGVESVRFDRHGEEAAWRRHSAMYMADARPAMTTETRGQNSAFIFALDCKEFPTQKVILPPKFATEV